MRGFFFLFFLGFDCANSVHRGLYWKVRLEGLPLVLWILEFSGLLGAGYTGGVPKEICRLFAQWTFSATFRRSPVQCWWLSHKYRTSTSREVLLHRAHYLEENIGVYSFLYQRILPSQKTRVVSDRDYCTRAQIKYRYSRWGRDPFAQRLFCRTNISIFPIMPRGCAAFHFVDGLIRQSRWRGAALVTSILSMILNLRLSMT